MNTFHIGMLQRAVMIATMSYTCNRGPRPSGAILVLPDDYVYEHSDEEETFKLTIRGNVQPTENSPSCKEVGCMMVDGHCVRNIHAEVDALLSAAKRGLSTEGATMYSINKPCYNCTIACIKAGISTIYYAHAVYDEERTRAALEEAGVECIHVPIE